MKMLHFASKTIAAIALVLALAVVSGAAQAQVVINTAYAQWQSGLTGRSTPSNEVAIAVLRDDVPITTYVFDANTGIRTPVAPTKCGNSLMQLVSVRGTAASGGAEASMQSLSPSQTVRIGEQLIIGLRADFANRDPAVADKLDIRIVTPGGDIETITISETGTDTGSFMGAIPTAALPKPPVSGDCLLSLTRDEVISIEAIDPVRDARVGTTTVTALADPFGYVFDSETGEPVDNAKVTLIDVATGLPAQVFGYDGVTPWPSTVMTGQSVVDGAGNRYNLGSGEYLFPLVKGGDYRLVILPPDPYSGPSAVPAEKLVTLTRPDGTKLVINDGSYGQSFTVTAPVAMQVDVPLDRPTLSVAMSKTASRETAEPGDPVVYTLTVRNQDPSRAKRDVVLVDRPSNWLRLRRDSIRIDGQPAPDAVEVSADGSTLTIRLGTIPGAASRKITYVMTVLPDAPAGNALNAAAATDIRGNVTQAQANVRITRESIAGRMTLIGRITDGDCSIEDPRRGIGGVRVMLEDGSFAITDIDGRYHFEGLVPGTHVVQVAEETLPEGGKFIDCTRSTRSAGKADSRFITGQGGSLVVADFHAIVPAGEATSSDDRRVDNGSVAGEVAADTLASAPPVAAAPVVAPKPSAIGGDQDWLALGDGPNGFLFPGVDHNPRAPAVRVAIRHRGDQKIELTANGEPVDPLAFDGTKFAQRRAYAVSVWRAVHIKNEKLELVAVIRNADGSVAETHDRTVYFSNTPARVQFVPEKSNLIADGRSRPVLAVRITDRRGNPVHSGMTGEFALGEPYESAQALDAMQSRALSGLDRARPVWKVQGDDGIAYIELAPTMVSGQLTADFSFTDGKLTRKQQLDAWVVPGEQKWTLVGLAEGSIGSKSVADNMERGSDFDSDLGENARVAFYAKGRVLGKFLLTLAYDSAKQKDDQPLLGAIDPRAYYTVFADGSDRRFDAASREKLYVRIEGKTFYALYGDFVTGFDQTELGRYNRTMTGLQGELRDGDIHVKAFAAEVGSTTQRDEIQGEGLTGPYQLSQRAIIANSERVVLETRDRFRSELVLESRELVRFIDYNIDLLAGTITFKEPILSRDASANPQFVVIDYEIDGNGNGQVNAGVRADVTLADGKVRIGTTLISDQGQGDRANLASIDVKAMIGQNTEVRAEVGITRGDETRSGDAWLVEVEHHDGNLDVLAYARSVSAGYGVAQLNTAERGRRKIGVDARYSFDENLSVTASGWLDDGLANANSRRALQVRGEYRTGDLNLMAGLTHFSDSLSGSVTESSTVLDGGITKRLFDNKLELSAISSIALGEAESVDLPVRHRFGVRYALTQDVRLVGSYEIANGENVRARTARAGLELSPWAGARIAGTLGQSDIAEFGKRSFAAFGLAQSLQLSEHLTVDATVDSNQSIGGNITAADVINPEHPAASGGQLSSSGSIDEDFTAVTLGATWRDDRWSITGRGEWRDGQFADRRGATLGAIRQIGEGRVVGAGFSWTHATGSDGATSEVFDGSLVTAIRPADSAVAWLAKLQFRSDKVTGAVAGEVGTVGNTIFNVDGDALSRRLIASVSLNWSPRDDERNDLTDRIEFLRRSEFGLFLGTRYGFDRIEGYDLDTWTLLGGIDARVGIGDHFEIGANATVRAGLVDGYVSYAFGPNVGISPTDDVLISVGYNFVGFSDPDFSVSRNTNQGIYVSGKVKFDADSFGFLGLAK